MNDRDSLLTAILAAPDEDTPRLMFADWLQENDETERAEFIRLQCLLEQIAPRSVEGKRVAKREKELQVALFGHLDLTYTFNGPIQWNVVGNSDSYMSAIADSSLFVRLSKLSLRGNGITDDGAKLLAASQHPVNLTRLDLADNPIGPVGKRSLRKRFGKDVCVFERSDDD